MTGDELLERLAAIKESSTITLSPGPFVARVGKYDAIAARLLFWLTEQNPEITVGEIEEVLLAALWWQTFLLCQYEENKP